jgi:beta-phosphoglucomutase-like phosphatase (HAD superfamily)
MILVDVDGTIAATAELLHKRFDVPLDRYPAPLPEGFWESESGLKVYRDVEPIPFAVEALNLVSDLVYVTVRPKAADFITARWLQKYGFPDAPVYFVKSIREKAQLAVQIGAVTAFDDDPKAPEAFAKRLVPAVLISRPYNLSVKAARVTWKSVLEEGLHALGNNPR